MNIGLCLRGSRLSISVVLPDAELCTLVGTDSSDSTESKSDESSVLLLESEQLKASSFVFPWLVMCFGLRMLSLSFLSFLRGVSVDEVVDKSDSSSLFLRLLISVLVVPLLYGLEETISDTVFQGVLWLSDLLLILGGELINSSGLSGVMVGP